MTRNEGRTDRTARFILGIAILILGALFATPWGLIGLVPLITGTIGFCPLYRLVGINTCGQASCDPTP